MPGTIPPPLRFPTEAPWQFSSAGVLTTPSLLAYFTRSLTPAVNRSISGETVYDTSANMVNYAPSAFSPGTFYFQNDRGILYVDNGTAWQYFTGTYPRLQSELAALAATLGTGDTGLLVNVTDYNHMLQWTGSAWQAGPGEQMGNFFQDFATGGPANPIGWHVCDGSSVSHLKADGSLSTPEILPDTQSFPAYRKLGSSYSQVITAATRPLLTMDSYTPQGTNSVPLLTMNSYTPGGTIVSSLAMNSYTPAGTNSALTFTGTAVGILNTLFVSVAGATVGLTALDGSQSTYTPNGTINTPTFTGTPATLTGSVTSTFTGTPATLTGAVTAPIFTGTAHVLTGTISLPGDPIAHHQAIEYFRI